MLELVMIIVVVGILAAVMIPRLNNEKTALTNAAKQIVSHIRYTQHLAMNDDKINTSDSDWFKKRWTLVFNKNAKTGNTWAYTIYSESVTLNPSKVDLIEVAKNPLDPSRYLTGGFDNTANMNYTSNSFLGTKELNIGDKYGITDVNLSASCKVTTSRRFSFDHLGRPLKGDLAGYETPYYDVNTSSGRLITNSCNITISNGSCSTNIIIEPETGYVHLSNALNCI